MENTPAVFVTNTIRRTQTHGLLQGCDLKSIDTYRPWFQFVVGFCPLPSSFSVRSFPFLALDSLAIFTLISFLLCYPFSYRTHYLVPLDLEMFSSILFSTLSLLHKCGLFKKPHVIRSAQH